MEIFANTVKSLNIFQIGVGGTGSWIVPPMCKFMNNIKRRYSTGENPLKVVYTLVDNDIVEDRNILRQNFQHEDIGRYKATALKRNNFRIFDNIRIVDTRISKKNDLIDLTYGTMNEHEINNPNFEINYVEKSLNIFIGCVDNNDARNLLYRFLKNVFEFPTVYFDCGNTLHSGQVVTTWFRIPEEYEIKNTKRKQIKFSQFFPKNSQEKEELTCAFFGDQSQSINMMSSTICFTNIQQLLIDQIMPVNIKQFNSAGRSYYEI
jgi:hypothetical protein